MSKDVLQKVCEECNTSFITKTSRQRCCKSTCYIKLSNRERSKPKKQWAENNKSAVRVSQDKWVKDNPDKRKKASSEYMKRNKPYYTMKSNQRRAVNKQAEYVGNDQEWYDFFMSEIYDLRDQRSKLTGTVWEVDHIVPLQSKVVCGLHTPCNLQIVERQINRSKSNQLRS